MFENGTDDNSHYRFEVVEETEKEQKEDSHCVGDVVSNPRIGKELRVFENGTDDNSHSRFEVVEDTEKEPNEDSHCAGEAVSNPRMEGQKIDFVEADYRLYINFPSKEITNSVKSHRT